MPAEQKRRERRGEKRREEKRREEKWSAEDQNHTGDMKKMLRMWE